MRVIALVVSAFLVFSTVEAWASYVLAARWFVSSRYASVTLGVVKAWLDRGIINSATQAAKVFIRRNGKWILLTLALSQVLRELEDLQRQRESASICYLAVPTNYSLYASVSTSSVYFSRSYYPGYTYTVRPVQGQTCNGDGGLPTYRVFRYDSGLRAWVNDVSPYEGWVPVPGTYRLGSCELQIRLTISSCPFSASPNQTIVYAPAPSLPDLEQERRQVPVRVFPNPADFVRPDVISQDPALSWLRDEYQRIASDSSIPTIPSDALGGVDLPQVDWFIPPEEEAVDSSAESSGSGSSSQEGSQEGSQDGSISIPGFDTSLNLPERRSFPVQLVNSLLQSHPLLRVLQRVSLDTGGGGSCVIGSRPFEFDFCPFQWVLNLMGGVITFVAFLTGFLWTGRSE
jgi:hypothetical protein